jgi:hypothetical protein
MKRIGAASLLHPVSAAATDQRGAPLSPVPALARPHGFPSPAGKLCSHACPSLAGGSAQACPNVSPSRAAAPDLGGEASAGAALG